MITTDANGKPAIEIGVDPSGDTTALVLPDELLSENLIFATVEKPRDDRLLIASEAVDSVDDELIEPA
ncbi:unnamed protein product [Symbiodinium microadriaticum]|nr:unnamed protein product [Symbiodinium microadriaticum]